MSRQSAHSGPAFSQFCGNTPVVDSLRQMLATERIPQTMLIGGPPGVGKATLVRHFAAELLGGRDLIEKDDLSLPANVDLLSEREKWTAEKRAEDPLLFASHPDFVTIAPDGPLQQISIQQVRALKDRAQFQPLRGKRRVFLIDQVDRANDQAANSLLKLLEEPPPYLVLCATASNLYDLLPTIRSRAVIFQAGKLSEDEMRSFFAGRRWEDEELRLRLAEGSPGLAVTLDLEKYRERRGVVAAALASAAGVQPFSAWIKNSESFAAKKTEKLELYLLPAYSLLEDILIAQGGGAVLRNQDIGQHISAIAARVNFAWIEAAARALDELQQMARRSVQKTIALDAVIMNLRNQLGGKNA